MKKAALFIILMFSVLSCVVSAKSSVKLSADSERFIVSGDDADIHENLKIIVLKQGVSVEDADRAIADNQDINNYIVHFGMEVPANTSFEKSIDMSGNNKGVYNVAVISSKSKDVIEIGYAALNERLGYLDSMITALSLGESNVLTELLSSAEYIGADVTNYKKVTSKSNIAGKMFADRERVSGLVPGNVGSLKKMTDFIDEEVFTELLSENKITDVNAISDLINTKADYADVRNLYNQTADEGKTVVLQSVAGKSYLKYSDLIGALKMSIALNGFNYTVNSDAANLLSILTNYSAISGLELGGLNSLSEVERATAVKRIYNERHTSFSSLQNAINAVQTENNSPVSGGGSGGGGVKGGGGKVNTNINIQQPEITDGEIKFSDFAGCNWAKEAVSYLVENELISGYPDNTYKPYNNITRAEFLRIVIPNFFELEESAEHSFEDVAADAWYCRYVITAFKNGVVSGSSETRFEPESYISRQDMAVILYNISVKKGFNLSAGETEISDAEKIADYAKNAVYALKNSEIINGYEDGSFKPADFANRAETAQMVYNFIIKSGGNSNEN